MSPSSSRASAIAPLDSSGCATGIRVRARAVSRSRRALRAAGLAESRSDAGVRREAEVGGRAVQVPIDDVPGHLAVADTEQVRVLGTHLPEIHAARAAVTAVVDEHDNAFVIDLSV